MSLFLKIVVNLKTAKYNIKSFYVWSVLPVLILVTFSIYWVLQRYLPHDFWESIWGKILKKNDNFD